MKQVHSQLKQKLSNLNNELNEIINKNYGKIKKTIKEKEETTSKLDIEAQKGKKKKSINSFKNGFLDILKKKIENIKFHVTNAKAEYSAIKAQSNKIEDMQRHI